MQLDRNDIQNIAMQVVDVLKKGGYLKTAPRCLVGSNEAARIMGFSGADSRGFRELLKQPDAPQPLRFNGGHRKWYLEECERYGEKIREKYEMQALVAR